VVLSAENKKAIDGATWFCTWVFGLSETASVMYKVDQLYNKESEEGIRYDDPTLAIDWQLSPEELLFLKRIYCRVL
jgi:dTDP-4-dehydrorhamnose 3,5-epimerase